MSDEHEHNGNHGPEDVGEGKSTAPVDPDTGSSGLRSRSRRRLTAAGLGGAMLVSLPAKSVWGAQGQCSLSGNIFSANVSNIDHECTAGDGCTSAFWKDNWGAWECTGYSPGSCIQTSGTDNNCQRFDATVGTGGATSFEEVFGYRPECLTGTPSLMEVLHAWGVCRGSLDWHAVGAVLNAACTSIDFGASVDEVIKAYSMAREDVGKHSAVTNVFAYMNERFCPINGLGDCGDGYTRNEAGECVEVRTNSSGTLNR
ncbi:hypothetical protein [Thioalkalivibrio versutus]|uniref:hypothetical protein n=1 Tax=Thioalkalivibrio versutus TaxID=106634 RepID=UPI00035CB637|nr:hypothetical protein [Thioalkalivibrio versutus]OOC51274.1 hypothetical protein B0684_00165 [Thioalkalivibrio versutus]